MERVRSLTSAIFSSERRHYRQNETFCRYFKSPLPYFMRVSGSEAVSFAPIKKLPTSVSVGLSSVPVTDRGSEEVNVSFSDFGARLRESAFERQKFVLWAGMRPRRRA